MRTGLLAAILAAGTFTTASAAEPQPKKRVPVLDFDNVVTQSGGNPYFATVVANPVKIVADLLVTRFVQDACCSVIERKAIDKLIAGQNLTNSDRIDPMSAAKLSKLLGVDAIIVGSITRYDRDDKTSGGTSVNFGGFGSRTPKTKHDIKGVVQISGRIISPDTCEILAVAQGAAQVHRKDVTTGYSAGSMIAIIGGAGAINDPVMHDATDQAVKNVAQQLEQNLAKLPPEAILVDGLVAASKASGDLILNVGSRTGVKVGDRLHVWQGGEPVRDPVTGKLLRYDDTLIGEAVVTGVDEISSEAAYKGTELVKPGDKVRSFPKP